MKATPTAIPEVMVIEPKVFGDARGFFFESFNQRAFNEATGLDVTFVQDNHSRSAKGVLRGLHYQVRQPQGKLVRVVRGAVFDVAVDVRPGSPTLGRWTAAELIEDNSGSPVYRQNLPTASRCTGKLPTSSTRLQTTTRSSTSAALLETFRR
jgi:dTDP-4-dehydrorhamnose 3,5-epimerase